jgi:Zn-dependent peptidase ImmA (M78 family)/DNA-binding XRE family transcriptional regulator
MSESTQGAALHGTADVFSATRLTIARERRGLTRKALAELAGVTPDAITKFEGCKCRPLSENVQRFAFALRFPLGWFYAPELDLLDPQALSFRARRSMTAELRLRATRAGDIAAGVLAPELHRRFVLSAPQLPDLSEFEPEEAARLLRHEWKLGLGPVSNMVHLLELRGAQVFWLDEPSPLLNAWSLWHNERPFVMLNIHNDAGCRARFDAAHELGHLVLHHGAQVIDGLEMEAQANRFASAFLLPPNQFKAECPRHPLLKSFFPLKKRWGVSISAMVMQCKTTGLYSEWEARRAFQEIATRGWKTREPDDLAIPRETSRLHAMVFERLRAKGISEDDFAQSLNLRLSDLREHMPFSAPQAWAAPQVEATPDEEKSPGQSRVTHLRLVV